MKISEVIRDNKEQFNEVKSYIETHCQPYLQEIGGLRNALYNKPLFRGIAGWIGLKDNPMKTSTVNQNRSPLDTPVNIHTQIDDWFFQKTNIHFRSSSVFCTGSLRHTHDYAQIGETIIIIPKGNYHYCWSPVYRDMYGSLIDYAKIINPHTIGSKEKTTKFFIENPAHIIKFLSKGHYKIDTGLVTAIDSWHEIMLHCNEVVMVNIKWVEKNMRNMYENI